MCATQVTVKLLIADLLHCSLPGSTLIHHLHPKTTAVAFCVSFVLLLIEPYPHQCSWAFAVPSAPPSTPNSPVGLCSTGVEPAVEPRVAHLQKDPEQHTPLFVQHLPEEQV